MPSPNFKVKDAKSGFSFVHLFICRKFESCMRPDPFVAVACTSLIASRLTMTSGKHLRRELLL